MILLDAYDELPNEFQKNLFVTNNLELLGRGEANATSTAGIPTKSLNVPVKAIIATGTELLFQKSEKYENLFVPREAENPEKDILDKALRFFKEVRIAPFSSKFKAYIRQRCALDVRGQFALRVGPLANDTAARLKKFATTSNAVAPVSTQDDNNDSDDDDGKDDDGDIKDPSSRMLVGATCQVLASDGGDEAEEINWSSVLHSLQDNLTTTGNAKRYGQVHMMASVMAASLHQPMSDMHELRSSVDDFCKVTTIDPNLCLFQDYMEAFDEMPELKELTATPLMVEIVSEILRELKNGLLGSDAYENVRLLHLMSEPAANVAWGCISQCRSKTGKRVVIGEKDKKVPQDLVNEVAFALLESSGESLSNDTRLGEIAKMHLKFENAEDNFDEKNDKNASEDGGRVMEAVDVDRDADSASGSIERASSGNAEVLDTTLEKAIKEHALHHALQNALQRPSVLCSRVYELFAARLTRHEAQKAIVAWMISSEDIEREVKAILERLAMAMTVENVTEISAARSNALFREPRALDECLRAPFDWLKSLRMGEIKAEPLRQVGGSLGFLKKVRFLMHNNGVSLPRTRHDLVSCVCL